MKCGLKVEKRQKKVKNLEKKTSIFFLFMRFYLERRNVTNKKGLFHAKFFEFEEFFHPPLGKINKPCNDLHRLKANETSI